MSAKKFRKISTSKMQAAGENAAAMHNVNLLRLRRTSNKFRVPSSKGPHTMYIVLHSPSGKHDSCSCEAQWLTKRGRGLANISSRSKLRSIVKIRHSAMSQWFAVRTIYLWCNRKIKRTIINFILCVCSCLDATEK